MNTLDHNWPPSSDYRQPEQLETAYERMLDKEDELRDKLMPTLEYMQYLYFSDGPNQRAETLLAMLTDDLLNEGPFTSEKQLTYCLNKYAERQGYIVNERTDALFKKRMRDQSQDTNND